MPKPLRELILAASSTIILIIILVSLERPASLLSPYGGVWSEVGRGFFRGELSISAQGLGSPVDVVIDRNSVPHIFAQSYRDAAYALGYLHAYHRLWQMDIQRRLAEGRLSEVVGRSALKQDIYMRIVGLHRSAENTVAWIEKNYPEVYAILESYSAGVNRAIDEMKAGNMLPLMFKLLEYTPDPWRPVDSIAWAKYMAWSLTNFWKPLVITYLAIKLGPSDVNTLFPVHPYYGDNITVVPGLGDIGGKSIAIDPGYLRRLDWLGSWATGVDLGDRRQSQEIAEAIESILELSGELPREIGSNNWVIGPQRSSVNAPILADDPHLLLSMPAIWYEAHISTPETNVRGVTLPGIPFIIIGYNENIAWGLTNTQIGVMDFYLERVSGDKYLYRGSWKPLRTIEERISIKGEGVYILRVNITDQGPIISQRGAAISFRWTGNAGYLNDGGGVTREAIAIYLVNKARSYRDLVEALRYWDVPSQNWAFIDRYGNYGIIIPGLFPYRVVRLPSGEAIKVIGSRSLLNGSGGYEWEGYVPYEDIPRTINPERGWAAAPNQMSIGPLYPYFILGGWWDPGARAQRIFQLLSSKERHSPEDFMSYQSDTYLWYAASTTPKLVSLLSGRQGLSNLERKALEILSRWNYTMKRDLAAPTIWWAWFSALYDEVFGSYYRAHGVKYRLYPSEDTMAWLINNMPESKWFGGDMGSTFKRALSRAVESLSKNLGGDPESWVWGRVHRLYLEHLSGLAPLSIGPVPEDGASATLMNAGFPYDLSALEKPVYVRTGPSWRMIVYFRDGVPVAYGVYPGGQLENPVSGFYSDSFDLWYSYKYRELDLPRSPQDIGSQMAFIRIKPG